MNKLKLINMSEQTAEILTQPERSCYLSVVNQLNITLGLETHPWHFTEISTADYLRRNVIAINFDRFLRNIDEETFLKLIKASKDDGKIEFDEQRDAAFFTPHATNGLKELATDIEQRLRIAISQGIISETDVDFDSLNELLQSRKDIVIFYSKNLAENHNRSEKQIFAAEIGHLIAKSFGITILLPEIEEIFDRACQVAIGEPISPLIPQDHQILEEERQKDQQLVDEYHDLFDGCNNMAEAERKKLRKAMPSRYTESQKQERLNKILGLPHMKDYHANLEEISIPPLEEYVYQQKTGLGYYSGLYKAHLRAGYVIEQIWKALEDNTQATERLPQIIFNALKLRESHPDSISILSFDLFTKSVLDNLDELNKPHIDTTDKYYFSEPTEPFNEERFKTAIATIQDFCESVFYEKPEADPELPRVKYEQISQYADILNYAFYSQGHLQLVSNYVGYLIKAMSALKERRPVNITYELPLSLVSNNFSRLEEVIRSTKKTDKLELMTARRYLDLLYNYAELAEQGYGRAGQEAVMVLERSIDVILAGWRDQADYNRYEFLSFLGMIVQYGQTKSRDQAKNIIMNSLLNDIDHSEVVGKIMNSKYPKVRELATPILKADLEKYQLDSEDLLAGWAASDNHHEIPIGNNLNTIIEIEKLRPGIAKTIGSEFGIRDFGRYPSQLLVAQYDEINNMVKPYGIILYPYTDHNGAFYGDLITFLNLYDQISNTHNLRIVECKSKQQAISVLNRLRKRYGKSDFAIIGGHGTANSIDLGEDSISLEDILRKGFEAASLIFNDSPTIILSSCSTGATQGIGQEISGKLNCTIIAPDKPTSISSISVVQGQDKLLFDVKYQEALASQTYRNAQNIKNIS